MGLIDSGATETAIGNEIAEILGLKKGKTIPIITAGGKTKGYESELTVEIPIRHNPVRLKLPCHILENFDEIILGRHGFFEAFEITFCESEGWVRLKDIRSKTKQKRYKRI